ncbi:hypothetical protein FA15DRAFT_671490 [Coprinopsis marcescibilis]|uniref:Uncharacterized protein n=1 Tax=Coprinopsis marcescibilis TaxID=230819 RepID=A0A5C3KQ43_COPMA|nr:hypothetical protein FA15DRAFT_671490 [Coprinopsis marcescibilis]
MPLIYGTRSMAITRSVTRNTRSSGGGGDQAGAVASTPPTLDGQPRLPVELLDLTISFLDEEPHALTVCARVSRSCCHVAQKRLFHTIAIKPPLPASPDQDAEVKAKATHKYMLLADKLQKSPQLRRQVHTLEVYLQCPGTTPDGSQLIVCPDHVSRWFALIPVIFAILPALAPTLQAFYLSGSGVRPGRMNTAYTACVDWLTFSPGIQKVFLEAATGPCVRMLGVGFITHVPGALVKKEGKGLDRVVTQSMIWRVGQNIHTQGTSEGRSVEPIVASRSNSDQQLERPKRVDLSARYAPVLQGIANAVSVLQLLKDTETISVSIQQGISVDGGVQNHSTITKTYNEAAGTLQHLWINIFEVPSPNWQSLIEHQAYDLSRLKQLRTFHRRYTFSVDVLGGCSVVPDPLPAIIGTLSTLDSDSEVEVFLDARLTIRTTPYLVKRLIEPLHSTGNCDDLPMPKLAPLGKIDWSSLNTVLHKSKLPSVSLRIRVMCTLEVPSRLKGTQLLGLESTNIEREILMAQRLLLDRWKEQLEGQLGELRREGRCHISAFEAKEQLRAFHLF